MAALLTIESQNSDKVALYLAECRDLGVPMLPADINASELQFVVQPDGVRFGLGAVKGAGEGAIRSILETRATLGGKITSVFALAEHIDLRLVNKKVLESLVKAGAFDSLAPDGVAELPELATEAARQPRSHPRPREPASEGSRPGSGAAVRRRDRVGRPSGRPRCPAIGARVGGNRGADVRERSARPVHVRPSAPALRRHAGDARRAPRSAT